jgi:hypothetical protein
MIGDPRLERVICGTVTDDRAADRSGHVRAFDTVWAAGREPARRCLPDDEQPVVRCVGLPHDPVWYRTQALVSNIGGFFP